MRLKQSLASINFLMENLGFCRLSAFYSEEHMARGKLVQRVARIILGIFAAISVYDIVNNKLSYKFKIMVHGALVFLVSCIVINIILNKFINFIWDDKKQGINTNKLKQKDVVQKLIEPINEKSASERQIAKNSNLYTPLSLEFEEDAKEIKKSEMDLLRLRGRNLLNEFEKSSLEYESSLDEE